LHAVVPVVHDALFPHALPPPQAVQPLAWVAHVCSTPPLHWVLPAAHCPAGHPHAPPPPAALHTRETPEHEVHGLPALPHAVADKPAAHEVALAQQPAQLLALHASAQVVPLPVYPLLQAHVLVPGPVLVHVAFASHPPLLVLHELTGVQVIPSPEYPVLHAHVRMLGPVLVHLAVAAQPPLFVAHAAIPVQVVPLPV
jgi:hypothetical protein